MIRWKSLKEFFPWSSTERGASLQQPGFPFLNKYYYIFSSVEIITQFSVDNQLGKVSWKDIEQTKATSLPGENIPWDEPNKSLSPVNAPHLCWLKMDQSRGLQHSKHPGHLRMRARLADGVLTCSGSQSCEEDSYLISVETDRQMCDCTRAFSRSLLALLLHPASRSKSTIFPTILRRDLSPYWKLKLLLHYESCVSYIAIQVMLLTGLVRACRVFASLLALFIYAIA